MTVHTYPDSRIDTDNMFCDIHKNSWLQAIFKWLGHLAKTKEASS
jgi:hypothetical protein